MKKYLVEFIGTFFLVLTVGMTCLNPDPGVIAPLAIGMALMIMVYAGGHVSGGAFNPAVATGITVMHLQKAANIWIYLVGNFAGGALAAAAFKFINPEDK